MGVPIGLLKDDFADNVIGELWQNAFVPTGSATRAETGGQARFTLPSATAGSHEAGYQTSATYDLTGDQVSINVDTMVSTSVAASAALYIFDSADPTEWIRIIQLSGTLSFQKNIGGVTTAIGGNVTWNSSTHKYWRMRESAGSILCDTSSNGTSWTNRGTTTIASAFDPVSVIVRVEALCGNVASPGSFRVEELNAPYPAPSAAWRETTADWGYTDRRGAVTLASDGYKQGVLVTADTMDESTRALGGTVRYFAGPLGSSSGGYLQLTEYASLVLAQASPFPIPVDGRVDFPAAIGSRYVRLYHRSIDASAHTIYEYVPRRLVQSDDVEAESIRAINIAAGAITADKIFVLTLGAITANIGKLNIDLTGYLYQGTGTGEAPTTGLKLFNSGGVGKLSGYNAGVEQITLDTDGKLKAGGGTVLLDANGVGITGPTFSYNLYNASPVTTPRVNMVQWSKSSGSQAASIIGSASAQLLMLADQITLAIPLSASLNYGLNLLASGAHSMTADIFTINFGGATGPNALSVQTNASNGGVTTVHGGLNVGSATGASVGGISTSGSVGFGQVIDTTARLAVKGQGATSATYGIVAINSSSANTFYVRNDGAGFLLAAAWTYGSDERLKEKIVKSDRGLAHLKLIEAKKFDYKDGQKDQLGFLAHEVALVLPELVVPINANDPSPTPMLGMLTGNLIPVLVSAVQELDRRLDALEKER